LKKGGNHFTILYILKSLTCREVGVDCDTVIKGDIEDEIMQKAGENVNREHNIKSVDLTSDIQQKIRG
jgi:predicted small metal-binding protein